MLKPFHVTLPNNQVIDATLIGSVTLNPLITLHNVFFFPNFQCNLLSINKLTKEQKRSEERRVGKEC